MAWNAPITFVANAVLTAAQLNAQLRDNMQETAPAKATTAGRHFVATGANAIAERAIVTSSVATAASTTSTSYVDLTTPTNSPGPAVTLTTGANALIWINARMSNGTVNSGARISFAVTGASSISAADARSAQYVSPVVSQNARIGACVQLSTLTAGSNTFTMKYAAVTAGTASFADRAIIVMGL